jgi:hypothetical protein
MFNKSYQIFPVSKYIINLIKKHKLHNCLEIGMGFGIYSFYILSNKNVKLISVDPLQKTKWHNYGVNLLKEFNFNKRHKIVNKIPDSNDVKINFVYIENLYNDIDYEKIDKILIKKGILIINYQLVINKQIPLKYKKLYANNSFCVYQKQ